MELIKFYDSKSDVFLQKYFIYLIWYAGVHLLIEKLTVLKLLKVTTAPIVNSICHF